MVFPLIFIEIVLGIQLIFFSFFEFAQFLRQYGLNFELVLMDFVFQPAGIPPMDITVFKFQPTGKAPVIIIFGVLLLIFLPYQQDLLITVTVLCKMEMFVSRFPACWNMCSSYSSLREDFYQLSTVYFYPPAGSWQLSFQQDLFLSFIIYPYPLVQCLLMSFQPAGISSLYILVLILLLL